MEIRADTLVADLAAEHPATLRVFESHGIDYCCGGRRPLEEVCAERDLGLTALMRELETALSTPRGAGPDWARASLREIVSGIIERYHAPLKVGIPRLEQMMRKVLEAHGARHRELEQVAATFGEIAADLGPHMMKEEQVLFPFLARLEDLRAAGGGIPASPFGSLENPIGVMEADHEVVGSALARLREQTSGYQVPADGCETFRGLYRGLADLERDLHEHIHVENNILFPRALRLEADRPGAARAKE